MTDDTDQQDGEPERGLTRRGLRQDGKSYKEGNTREDGSYENGKNRAPVSGRFAVGNGRKRGRRAKGTRNFDTEFIEEANRVITITENGKKRKTTKRGGTVIRAFDRAYGKGDAPSIALVWEQERRIAERAAARAEQLSLSDREIIEQFEREQAEKLAAALAAPESKRGKPGVPGKDGAADLDNHSGE